MAPPDQKLRCERCRAEIASGASFCPMCGTPRSNLDVDPLLGGVLADRYVIKERLGKGVSGTIYLGEHVTLKRKVAVKVLHDELSQDDLAVERFRREATTVGEIDNEHIVEVYDFGRLPDGRLFLAMELLDGETLAAVIKKGRLPTDQVIDILTQVGEALMEAHAMGYVHRDLRPGNVMLVKRRGKAGRFVKLLDFGLAKLIERDPSTEEGRAASTSLGMTFGDPSYMSPEQARGEGTDRRADIYSLGVMAFEMLTGQPPFVGKKVFDVLMQHIETPPKAPSSLRSPQEIPPWLDAIVLRALAKKPSDRFVTVYRLIEALREGQATGQVMTEEAAKSMPASEPPPPAPRHRDTPVVQQIVLPPPGASVESSPPAAPPNGATASNRLSMPAATSASGMSGAWYADGELEAPAGVSTDSLFPKANEPPKPAMPKPVDKRRSLAETGDDLPRVRGSFLGGDESIDGYERPKRGKALPIAGAVLLLAVGFFIVLAVVNRSGKSSASSVTGAIDAGALVADAGAPLAIASTSSTPAITNTSSSSAPRKITSTTRPHAPDPGESADPAEHTTGPRPPVMDFRPRPDAGPASGAPESSAATSTALKPSVVSPADSGQADFFVKLGEKALREGDIPGATANFNKARAFDNTNAEAIAGIGQIAMRQGSFDEAVVHLEAASRLAPKSAHIHTLRGQAYLGAGKKGEAAEAFKTALKIDPDDTAALKGYRQATLDTNGQPPPLTKPKPDDPDGPDQPD